MSGILILVASLLASIFRWFNPAVSAILVLSSLVLVAFSMIAALVIHTKQDYNKTKVTAKQETVLDILTVLLQFML